MLSTSKALFRNPTAGGGGTTDPSFAYVPLLLNTTSTNGQNNQGTTTTNGFLDSSSSPFTITRNGTPTQGSFTPYWPNGQWSNYFVAASSQTILTTQTQVIPTGNFTIELFVYVTSSTATQAFVSQGTSGSAGRTAIGIDNSSGAKWFCQVGGVFVYSSAAPVLNTWNYLAMTYNGTQIALYLNGTLLGSQLNVVNAQNEVLRISGLWTSPTAGYYLDGYLSNVRVSNTVRTVTSTPTAPFTSDANTTLLTCQGNRFVDVSGTPKTLTPSGGPLVQAFQPFSPTASYTTALYGGSGYFNGTDAYLTYNQTFALGTNDFTLEFWLNIPVDVAYPTNYWLWGWRNGTNNCPALYLAGVSGGGNTINFTGGASNFLSNPNRIPTNTWTHVAIVRSGLGTNNLKMYINGAQVAQSSTTQSFTYTGTQPVGANPSGDGGLYPSNVYFSNFRIVNGTAVYTAAFTPPTSPLTAITNTALLLNFTNAGIYDAAAQNDMVTGGTTQASSTITPKWGTTSMKFNGATTDYLYAPVNSADTFGSGNWTIEGWFNFSSVSGNQEMFSKESLNSAQSGIRCVLTSARVQFQLSSNGSTYATTVSCSTALTTGVWYYLAFVRNGIAITVYLNGTSDGTGSFTGALYETNTFWALASRGLYSGGTSFNGYIQDFRITKGVARTITTPTAAFPTR
jgi:hypothetical protein